MNFINYINFLFIKEYLIEYGFHEKWSVFLRTLILVFGFIFFSYVFNFIAKKVIIRIVNYLVNKSKAKWDSIFLEKGVFNRLSHLVPAFIILYSAKFVFSDYPALIRPVWAISYIYIVIVSLIVSNAFINASHDIYLNSPVSRSRPIKGYIQVVKIIIFFIGGIIILSALLGESPYALLAGLGAMTAVILIVFKDSILGLVASIQLSENKMLKPGDYIMIPNNNLEGTVKEISLSSVKIHNPDNTFSYVPTYSLISQPFSNWIGVKESGANRIKRSINIDIRSIRFCNDNLLRKIKEVDMLNDFVASNIQLPSSSFQFQTNLGLYRKYIEFYLKKLTGINLNYPFLIHQLQPSNNGLPIEIYIFVNELDWIKFEAIQSEIFEHLIAIMREFELSPYQLSNL
jgi:miniconductance mechanosensitive channel